MNLKGFTLLLSLICTTTTFAERDFGQALPGQVSQETSPYEGSDELNEEENAYQNVFGSLPQQYTDEELKGAQMSEQDKEWLKTTSEEGSILINPNKNSYMEYSDSDLVKDSYQISKSEISFSYLYDTFDYKDKDGIYNKTFKNKDKDAHALQSGYIVGSYKHFFQRNIVSSFFQLNGAISYNKGRGLFATPPNDPSRTVFTLWLFPIDLNLGARFNMGRSVSLTLQGGPTIVPIWQNRSDREDGEDGKDVKQVGYGYNASASLDLSLFNMFPNLGRSLKGASDIKNMSVNILARTMGVSGFKKEDFEISGASFGLGFSFEYL